MFTEIKSKKLKIYLKHPQFKMAGIALKRSVRLCFLNGPPEVSLKAKNVRRKEKIYVFSKGYKRNAAFSRLLIDCFVTAFRILIK